MGTHQSPEAEQADISRFHKNGIHNSDLAVAVTHLCMKDIESGRHRHHLAFPLLCAFRKSGM